MLSIIDSFVVALVMIVAGYILLLFVMARLSSNEEWKQNLKIELQQLLLSLLLLIGVYAIAGFVTMIYQYYTGGLDAFNYLSIQLISIMKNLHFYASHLTLSASLMRMFGEFTNIGYPHGSYGSARLPTTPGVDLLASVTFQIRDLLMIATGGLVMQSILFDLIKNLALTVVLPIGIVLRILPITRQFGNELIGLSVSSYIILPIIYLVFFQTIQEVANERGGFIERFVDGYLAIGDTRLIEPDKIIVDIQKDHQTSIQDSMDRLNNYFDRYKSEIDSEVMGSTADEHRLYRFFETYLTTGLILGFLNVGFPISFLFLYSLLLYASGFLVFGFGLPGFAIAITLTAAKSIRDSLERLV
ncbi:MAG: hypothetical protein QXE47_00320 [Candidatus Anstonellales archaeon]